MKRVLLAWILGICLYSSLSHWFVPGPTCADGTSSAAIGRQGACSWHGGVKGSAWGGLAFIASIAVGVLVAKWPSIVEHYRASARAKELRATNAPFPNRSIKTPYGTLEKYEEQLRSTGISEEHIRAEVEKYRRGGAA